VRQLSIVLAGNLLLVTTILALSALFEFPVLLINLLGSSIIFALITAFLLIRAARGSKDESSSLMIMLSAGAFLVRLLASLLWIAFIKKVYNPESNSFALIFILVYLYYLIADVILLTRIVNPPKKS
jgi:hypothetical protein